MTRLWHRLLHGLPQSAIPPLQLVDNTRTLTQALILILNRIPRQEAILIRRVPILYIRLSQESLRTMQLLPA